eukprot:m.418681 g.418681  ORF g.418681 m.418681 type:complete len:159 (-) comp21293_c0_seq14:602-1078(-)
MVVVIPPLGVCVGIAVGTADGNVGTLEGVDVAVTGVGVAGVGATDGGAAEAGVVVDGVGEVGGTDVSVVVVCTIVTGPAVVVATGIVVDTSTCADVNGCDDVPGSGDVAVVGDADPPRRLLDVDATVEGDVAVEAGEFVGLAVGVDVGGSVSETVNPG